MTVLETWTLLSYTFLGFCGIFGFYWTVNKGWLELLKSKADHNAEFISTVVKLENTYLSKKYDRQIDHLNDEVEKIKNRQLEDKEKLLEAIRNNFK